MRYLRQQRGTENMEGLFFGNKKCLEDKFGEGSVGGGGGGGPEVVVFVGRNGRGWHRNSALLPLN